MTFTTPTARILTQLPLACRSLSHKCESKAIQPGADCRHLTSLRCRSTTFRWTSSGSSPEKGEARISLCSMLHDTWRIGDKHAVSATAVQITSDRQIDLHAPHIVKYVSSHRSRSLWSMKVSNRESGVMLVSDCF